MVEYSKTDDNVSYNEKVGLSRHLGLYITISVVIIFILSSIIIFSSPSHIEGLPKCGDGTFYERCSLSKPYYCSGGVLIEDSSYCGCPDTMYDGDMIFKKVDGMCDSDYFDSGELHYYNYVLDGNTLDIPFEIYPSITDLLKDLPRYVIYRKDEVARRDDFKLMKMDVGIQKEALMPLIVSIENLAPNSTDMQAKIAVSLVQNIPYGEPGFKNIFGTDVRLSRYPYEVLNEDMGSCEGKSELLAFILRELGFSVSVFYYPLQNHEAVGIACPLEHSYMDSGYCFIETTVPAPISYSTGYYLGIDGGRLISEPEIIPLSKGISLSENIDDYDDSEKLSKIVDSIEEDGTINALQRSSYEFLKEKYGLNYY